MRALITFHTTTIEGDLQQLEVSWSSDDPDLRILSINSGLFGFPPNARLLGNFFYANWRGLFDEIAIGHSVRLFTDAWSRAFLRHCCRNLREAGLLHIPFKPAVRAQSTGFWSQGDLSVFLRPLSMQAHKTMVTMRGPNPPPEQESTLDWFVENSASLVINEVVARNNEPTATLSLSDSLITRMNYDNCESAQLSPEKIPVGETENAGSAGLVAWVQNKVTPWMQNEKAINFEAELQKALSAQSYYVGGIAYKGPVLKHILRTHGLADRLLSAVDFGGGYGLLMAELLLDRSLMVERVVVRDIMPSNRLLATHMFRELYGRIGGRFYFSLGSAEDFIFRERFDLVTFIGSLLYVPSDKRMSTLERCWDGLKPGGVLVIHENIKAPSYSKDYHLMFTVEEIDALLGQFGTIERYASTEMRVLSVDDAGTRSVFRVVQKPTRPIPKKAPPSADS